MGTQLYNISEINKKAGEVRGQHKELKDIIASMDSIVKDLSSVWKDAAQPKFVKQFEELRLELDKFCKAIDDFAQRAEKHAKGILNTSGGNSPV